MEGSFLRLTKKLFLMMMLGVITTTTTTTTTTVSALSSSSLLLQGKRILITGGGRGIGRSLAVICYQEGANVIITSRTKQELEETIRIATTKSSSESSSGDNNNNNNNNNTNEEEENEDEKQLRLNQATKAAMLLSLRGSSSSSSNNKKSSSSRTSSKIGTTSLGARRTGSATKARRNNVSSLSKIVNAVKTGTSTIASSSDNDKNDGTNNNNNKNWMKYYVCDVTNEKDVDTMVRDICGYSSSSSSSSKEDDITNTSNNNHTDNSTIDIVINNAGGGQSKKGPIGTLESNDFESLFKLNVLGPQLITSTIMKYNCFGTRSQQSTSEDNDDENNDNENNSDNNNNNNHNNNRNEDYKIILNISSKAGKIGLENMSHYVATKFAVEGLTSSWSKELYSQGIRVHSISPGMIHTKAFPKADPTPKKGGVRDVSSIQDCLLYILTGKHNNKHNHNNHNIDDDDSVNKINTDNDNNSNNTMMDYTGHYIHIDEYDQVITEQGTDNAFLAWKPIDEKKFQI